MAFQFSYRLSDLEKQDWKAFYRCLYRLRPLMGLYVLALRVLAGFGAAVMFFVTVGILADSDARSAVTPAVLCLVNLSVAIGYQRAVIYFGKRRLRDAGESMTVTIDDSGVTDRTGGVTAHYDFSALYALYWCRDVYLLFISKRAALVLPERFREGGSSAELYQFLEEKTGKSIKSLK